MELLCAIMLFILPTREPIAGKLLTKAIGTLLLRLASLSIAMMMDLHPLSGQPSKLALFLRDLAIPATIPRIQREPVFRMSLWESGEISLTPAKVFHP